MAEPIELPQKAGGVVPYFFYDLYGRILPGLFLLCGFIAVWSHRNVELASRVAEAIKGASALGWGVALLGVVAVSFLVGFLLSEVTRITLWRFKKVPSTLGKWREHFGEESGERSSIGAAFEAYFGFRLDLESKNEKYLIYCARLCEFAVAIESPPLDAVATRVAAEELLSGSLFWASVFLAVANAWALSWLLLVYLVLAGLSYGSYDHYREKGIREKFQMFLAVTKSKRVAQRCA